MLLSLQAISKRRDDSATRMTLDDVTLQVGRGQVVGVFGRSGSGKTTLLQIAAGLAAPDSGAVSYDGQRLDRLSSTERLRLRRREIACVWGSRPPQRGLSVLDHVQLALLVDHRDRRDASRRAREALLACEAEHCERARLEEISDGERQRVEIARALTIEPKLLLADSPASNLSIVEQETIMRLLATLARDAKVAVLITAGDAQALIGADPVLYLSGGRIVDPHGTRQGGTLHRFPGRARLAAADG